MAPGAGKETKALRLQSAKGSAARETRQGAAPSAGLRKPLACGAGGETSRGFARELWEGDGSPAFAKADRRAAGAA